MTTTTHRLSAVRAALRTRPGRQARTALALMALALAAALVLEWTGHRDASIGAVALALAAFGAGYLLAGRADRQIANTPL